MADARSGLAGLLRDEARRRKLSFVILGAAIAILLLGSLAFAFLGEEARGLHLVLAVLVLLLAAAEAYVLIGPVTPRPKARQAEDEFLLADEAPVLHEDVYEVKCGRCATQFQVADHLQRPLVAVCPVCGAEGIVPIRKGALGEDAPAAGEPR